MFRGASVEHRPGDVTVSGFLFDMARVFEDFVTVALRGALADSGGHCVLQATHHLGERQAIRMVPDFVRHAHVTIHRHALELDRPPAGLLAEVEALARRLVAVMTVQRVSVTSSSESVIFFGAVMKPRDRRSCRLSTPPSASQSY